MRNVYWANIHREGTAWVGTVLDLEGVHSWHPKSLAGLRQSLAEAIVLAEDLPDDAIAEVAARIDLDVDFGDRDVDAIAGEAAGKREVAARAQREAETATAEAVRKLTDLGLSNRDVGVVLGISHQRVAQLAPKGLKQAN